MRKYTSRAKYFIRLATVMVLSCLMLFGQFNIIFAEESAVQTETEDGIVKYIINDVVRITPLSDTLVRIEEKGNKGFEDRNTYYVVGRDRFETPESQQTTESDCYVISTSTYNVKVPQDANSLVGVMVTDIDGNLLYKYEGDTTPNVYLPSASDDLRCWYFSDSPRIVPSEYGYSYSLSVTDEEFNDWDFDNNAPDMYVFLPNGDYKRFCSDYTKLTGPSNLLDLKNFGYWDSRWYAYSTETALQQIQDYLDRGYSIDMLVIDTNWRANADGSQPSEDVPNAGGVGYNIDTNLFPSLPEFFERAHEMGVNITFNDHPEPVGENALNSGEIEYRSKNLKMILGMGLDFWWYDRNWSVALNSAHPDISVFAFGMYAYQFITDEYYQNHVIKVGAAEYARRAVIMGNVDGCLNGQWKYASDISSHRYTLQWTGDVNSDEEALAREIRNSVYGSLENGIPYISSDIGGHTQAVTDEMYCRWMQYGALSAICRVHCTHKAYIGQTGRMPWLFGDTAENVTKTYVGMRYNLLPTFYSLAGENAQNGLPILRRLDIEYPQYAESARNDEYLLGEGVLIAPISEATYNTSLTSITCEVDGVEHKGLLGKYYTGKDFETKRYEQIDEEIMFDWGTGGPLNLGSDNFSVEWSGFFNVGNTDLQLQFYADDGVKVWIDDILVVDSAASGTEKYDTLFKTDYYPANTKHSIKIKYFEDGGYAHIYMYGVEKPISGASVCYNTRTVFLPDGEWIDAWSGKEYVGPQTITVTHPLETSPIFIRKGSLTILAPDMKNTEEKDWSELTIDAYPGKAYASTTLYEDDTITQAYKEGRFRTTLITSEEKDGKYTITINPAVGEFDGEKAFSSRTWNVRIHAFEELGEVKSIKVNGVEIQNKRFFTSNSAARPFSFTGEANDSNVYEISFKANISDLSVITIDFENNNALAEKDAKNNDYENKETTFIAEVQEGGNVVDLNATGSDYIDWAFFGSEQTVRKNGVTHYVSELSSEFEVFNSYDSALAATWTDGDKVVNGIEQNITKSGQVDFNLTLKVDSTERFYIVYLSGEWCTAKLTIRDRAGNVQTLYIDGNLSGKFSKRVVIKAKAEETTYLYLRYSMHATKKEPGRGLDAYSRLSIPLITVSNEMPTANNKVYGPVSANRQEQVEAPNEVYNLSESDTIRGESCKVIDWFKAADDANGNDYIYMQNGENICDVIFNNVQVFYDYPTLMSWTDGDPVTNYTQSSGNGLCTHAGGNGKIEILLNVDENTKYVRLFTGTWNSTNKITMYDWNGKVIALGESFTADSVSEKRMVTFEINAQALTRIKIVIESVNEQGGNVSLSAVQVFGDK